MTKYFWIFFLPSLQFVAILRYIWLVDYEVLYIVPVAQSVQRWTPRGESTRPSEKGPGFEERRALDVYGLPGGYG